MVRIFRKKDKDGEFIRFGKTGKKHYFKNGRERGEAMRSAAAEMHEARAKEKKENASKDK